jgi:hypothetical protein
MSDIPASSPTGAAAVPVDEGDGELDMASTASCLISASTVIFLVGGWGEVKKGESWDSQEMIATRRTR